MRHLTPGELVEAAEGTLGAGRLRHVEGCESCAAALADVRTALADLRSSADMPEPSPLFWEHFSRRVREATDAEPVPGGVDWWRRVWRPALAAGLLGTVALVWVFRPGPGSVALPDDELARQAEAVEVGQPAEQTRLPSSDALVTGDAGRELLAGGSVELPEVWSDVALAASRFEPADVDALVPTGGVAVLVEDLTQAELAEFARLLRAEMGGVR